MLFDALQEKLDKTFRDLRGVGKLSEKNIEDALREIRLALLEADVEFSIAKEFIGNIREQAVGVDVLKSIKPGEQIVKIFRDELAKLLGSENVPLDLETKDGSPTRILVCGLNGAGKTTSSAKLALRLKKQGRRPVLIACDLYRPAAIDQLATLAGQVDVPAYLPDRSEKNVTKSAGEAIKWIAANHPECDTFIFDTAGRQELDDALIDELKDVHKFIEPHETLLVADAATGQAAVSVAERFDEAVGLTGIVLSKLDGDARGGASLSMRAATGTPIKFIGEGEKMEDFTEFHPQRMADRILGMGDVVSLVEQAADKIDEKDAMRSIKRMSSGQFDFNDFLDQMKMLKKLGPLEGLMGLIPGMGKLKKQIPAGALDPKKFARQEAIVLSMTPYERGKPGIIKGSRRRRIANGSGTTIIEVNQLIKQFTQMQKMMKGKGKMSKLMKQLGADAEAEGGAAAGLGGGLPGGGKMPDMKEMEKMMKQMSGGKGLPDMSNLFGKK